MAIIIDGKVLAEEIRQEAKKQITQHEKNIGSPCLAIIHAGDDPASEVYIAAKTAAFKAAGLTCRVYRFPAQASAGEIISIIGGLNQDTTVNGILVQLPLPSPADTDAIIRSVDPKKDVDGFCPAQLGNLAAGTPHFIPCTPQGIMYAIRSTGISIAGRKAAVIGRSRIVGIPLALLLTHAHATVTLCHSQTENLSAITREADILITAAGSPALVTADMVKKGAVVIDAGINRVIDGSSPKGSRITGDADFPAVCEQAGWITPVPGGVGPLTVAMLIRNTVTAALEQAGIPVC